MNVVMEGPRQPPASVRVRQTVDQPGQTWPAPPEDPLTVDEHGAPVTFEAARWLVRFVPGLRSQFWHRFVHPTHKHVLMLKPNSDGSWTLFEPWWTRLLVRTISTEQALRFLQWASMGDMLLVDEDVPGKGSQIRGWSNCVSLATFVLGRSYCVWSPHGLFKRLMSEDRTEHVNLTDFIHRHVGEGGEPIDRALARRLGLEAQ